MKSIPHNINVINKRFITDKKYRVHETQQDPIDEYNNLLKEATSIYTGKQINNRRLSGFSKAISPNEPNFHPSMNEHVQDVPKLNTNSHLLMKASNQQHSTQNLMHAPVEPQLHCVQFHSPMKSNTPERGVHLPSQLRKTIS